MSPVIYLNERHLGRMKKNESSILRAVRDYLRLRGWFVIRIQQGLGAHKGITDLIAIKNGVTVWIECKTASGKLSEHQKRFQEQITASGGIYIIARGVEDIIKMEKDKTLPPPFVIEEGGLSRRGKQFQEKEMSPPFVIKRA